MEGTGIAKLGEHQFPVRYWITVSIDQRGKRGKGQVEMPSMEAVRLVDNSQLTLELDAGGSMNIVVVATGVGPVVSVESTGPFPGY
jgi:hypothetical protein